MSYGLPKSVEINGENFDIRYDFRVVLDIFEALNDAGLSEKEKAFVVLKIFYVDFENITDYNVAIQECFSFINGGAHESTAPRSPKLVDWENDFTYIIAPINRVVGYEVRERDYDIETNTGGVHWHTFLSAYYEIGDCLFAQIVSIRDKKARGKKLDKTEREFYKRNRDIVDFKTEYSAKEDALLKQWAGG